MRKTIYYLAHAYKGREATSVAEEHEWFNEMVKKGLLAFGPIKNSHFYHLWVIQKRKKMIEENDGVTNDDIMTKKYPIPDYVEEDLSYLEAWLNNDYGSYICPYCHCTIPPYIITWRKQCLKCGHSDNDWEQHKNTFGDSGVVILMHHSAYNANRVSFIRDMEYPLRGHVELWTSSGCLREFNWGINKHVPVYALEPFVYRDDKFRL